MFRRFFHNFAKNNVGTLDFVLTINYGDFFKFPVDRDINHYRLPYELFRKFYRLS